MRTEDFRKGDEAWIVVDVDTWGDVEFAELLSWAASDPRHHLAISNPKFELFLVMHFERWQRLHHATEGRCHPQTLLAPL